MSVITNIEDLRVLAEKRVPRMFYDYADSGSWTESTYRANESDFQKIKLRQRVAVNMENRSTRSTMICGCGEVAPADRRSVEASMHSRARAKARSVRSGARALPLANTSEAMQR